MSALVAQPVLGVNLAPLLSAPGTTVVLNGATSYTIGEHVVAASKTIECNGATIQSTGGPIRASGSGVTLIVDNCVIQGTGWALLGATYGASLVVRNNTRMTGNQSNSGIYLAASSLDLTGGSIDNAMWGINMENASAALHGVSIINTVFGVQNVAGTARLDSNTQLRNLNGATPGVGVSVIGSASYPTRRASAIVHDTTITGFGNGVDIQPTAAQGLPGGTAEIVGVTFNAPFYSALAAVDAVDVRFLSSRVLGAKTDGIYLVNSTAVIERSEIRDSLNTGVTFWGCPNGATIRASVVAGSAHQGVAVVADSANGRVSRNVAILDNTLTNNAIANVLVAGGSEALVSGNTMTSASTTSVRLHDGSAATLIGNLLLGAAAGVEVKDGSALDSTLSAFNGHDTSGALVYANAAARFSHCAFQGNGASSGDYSVFANSGAQVAVQYCTLGPAGAHALYNNAATGAVAAHNYWASAAGPQLPPAGGSGSILGWNTSNGSSATYQPFLTSTPVNLRVNALFDLFAGATSSWQPNINLTLNLTGAAGTSAVSDALVAALRLADSATLTVPAPPPQTYPDGVTAVWAEYDLLARAREGVLRFRTSGAGAAARVSRLDVSGCWLPVASTWDAAADEIVYRPTNPRAINGVFALGAVPSDEAARARQMITSFYADILGRAPEAGAVDSWYQGYFAYSVPLGIDVRFVPREMARIFFSSAEYAMRLRTDEQFLRDAYQVFLRRPPSQSELDAWLAGTWNRPQVVAVFAESAEFAAYVRALFSCLEGSAVANFVTTMYVGLLDRLVDSEGLAYYVGVFDAAYASGGIDRVQSNARVLGTQLMTSSEYLSGSPTHETHVVRLYRAYLARFPGTDEIAYWRGQLDAQTSTLDTLLDVFATSTEFGARLRTFFGP